MITPEQLDHLEKQAKRIFSVKPCNETIDGWGVAVCVIDSNEPTTASIPAFSREEFIEQFTEQNKKILELIAEVRHLESIRQGDGESLKYLEAQIRQRDGWIRQKDVSLHLIAGSTPFNDPLHRLAAEALAIGTEVPVGKEEK